MATSKSSDDLKEFGIDSKFVKVKKEKPDLRKTEQPLVDVKVTNPITYIKSWWKKIIGNEGIELKIKVKPLTAIAMSIIIMTVTLGIGRFVFPFKIPFFEYSMKEDALPELVNTREAAFVGTLRYEEKNDRYYLITQGTEAIKLSVPENLDLSSFIGRKMFAEGDFYDKDLTLYVKNASNMEILPTKTEVIPTLSNPTPTPNPSKSGQSSELINDQVSTTSSGI